MKPKTRLEKWLALIANDADADRSITPAARFEYFMRRIADRVMDEAMRSHFFIYHSYTGKLEAVPLSEGATDITTLVSDGTWYGGYYKYCGGVTKENVECTKALALARKREMADVPGAVIYDGSVLKNDGVRFFTKTGDDGQYMDTNGDDPGTSLHPEGGAVYYLKEVPDIYMSLHLMWSFDPSQNNKILYFFRVMISDDTFYKSIGCEFNSVEESVTMSSSIPKRETAHVCMETNGVVNELITESAIKIVSTDIIGQRGYTCLNPNFNDGDIANIFAAREDTPVIFTPYYYTNDGVKIVLKGRRVWCTGEGNELTTDNIRCALA